MNKNTYKEMYQSIHVSPQNRVDLVNKIERASKDESFKSDDNMNNVGNHFKPVIKALCACACTILIFTAGTGIYTVRAEDSYITMDSTASIGMSVNRWNKVIRVDCKNAEAYEMLKALNLMGLDYDAAVNAVLEYERNHGVTNEGAVTIEVNCNRESHAQEMQKKMDQTCEKYNYKCNNGTENMNGTHEHSSNGAGAGNDATDESGSGQGKRHNYGGGHE